MATAAQVKALIQSYSSHNDEQFRTVALQIAAQSARRGNTELAAELRALVQQSRRPQSPVGGPRAVPMARPSGELAGLISASYPQTRLADMVLAETARGQLASLIKQQIERDRLRAHGLRPKRKLLLVGPPGCGKTMSAAAIAGECQLPLFFVQLHALITRYLGETAAKLNLVFEAMAENRGLYFFDEFDAIGATRGTPNDVGEIRRVVSSFLQLLERDDSDSLIVAATNFVGMLDDALFRRFDDVIRYELPDTGSIRLLIENRLSAFELTGMNWKSLAGAARGLSHAEVVRACEESARGAVLARKKQVDGPDLAGQLRARAQMRGHPSGPAE